MSLATSFLRVLVAVAFLVLLVRAEGTLDDASLDVAAVSVKSNDAAAVKVPKIAPKMNGEEVDFDSLAYAAVRGNIALKKPTKQSSDLYNGGKKGGSALAVDGNTNGVFSRGSVTHTKIQAKAYWGVNLLGTFKVGLVRIFPRTDCCRERLVNFNVILLRKSQIVYTKFIAQKITSNSLDIKICPGVIADGVRIQLTGKNALSLAEVQVYVDGDVQNGASCAKAVTVPQTPRTTGDVEPASMKGMTAQTNVIRSREGAKAMVWDATVALYAQQWANIQGANDCNMEHRSNGKYAESLAWVPWIAQPKWVADYWASEKEFYNPSTGQCSDECGHWQIMVDKGMTRLGCGVYTCSDGPKQLWVCNYV